MSTNRTVSIRAATRERIAASGVSPDLLITQAIDAAGAPPFEPPADAHLVPLSVSARVRDLMRAADPHGNRARVPQLDAAINRALDAAGAP